jgi:hypothetical protein
MKVGLFIKYTAADAADAAADAADAAVVEEPALLFDCYGNN